MMGPRISVIIPVRNEERSIGLVLDDLPRGLINEIVVVDNGSTDGTGEIARRKGARVVREEKPGYGRACLAGVAAANAPDILVFLDGDYSDHADQLPALLAPILDGRADMVLGARIPEGREPGAMTPQAVFGNWLATTLIRALWGRKYRDLGPFRAITIEAYRRLGMRDENYGWTVEMQIKALRRGLRVEEIPVKYRRRIGKSKISGTIRGTIGAGWKIVWTIARYAVIDRK